MKPLLAPLVGDASTVTVIGLCKNAGKTTALCRLIAELEGETLAMTSVGRDGERTDVVTGTEKPEIWVRAGTLFATARGLLPQCDVTVQALAVTDVHTPLGQVAVLRALSDGWVQLAGPSAVGQLEPLERTFRELGARRVLIDGAAGRKSLAAAGNGCAILCVGASMEGTMEHIAAETAHVCALFGAQTITLEHQNARFALFDAAGAPLELKLGADGQPEWKELPGQDCILWVRGGVTGAMLRTLAQRGAPVSVAAPDATHFLFDRSAAELFARRGGRLRVERAIPIAAVCANSWSAYGRHLGREEFLKILRGAVALPVVDVRGDEHGDQCEAQ